MSAAFGRYKHEAMLAFQLQIGRIFGCDSKFELDLYANSGGVLVSIAAVSITLKSSATLCTPGDCYRAADR